MKKPLDDCALVNICRRPAIGARKPGGANRDCSAQPGRYEPADESNVRKGRMAAGHGYNTGMEFRTYRMRRFESPRRNRMRIVGEPA